MRKLLTMAALLLAVDLFLSSCRSYVQYLDVASELPVKNSYYTFENNDCKVVFDFWGEYGNSAFTFYNKTEEGLYINLSKSAMSLNGVSCPILNNDIKISLNQEVQTLLINEIQNTSSTYSLNTNNYNSAKNNTTISIPREKNIICVAPFSMISINSGKLCRHALSFADYRKDSPKKYYSEKFTKENSPVRFSFWLYYFFKENKDSHNISANFYVSKIENRINKLSVETNMAELNGGVITTTEGGIKGESPKRFYIKKTEEIKGNPNSVNKRYEAKKQGWRDKHGW